MFNWKAKEIKATNAIFLGDKSEGEGRPFKARFLQAGLVKYDFGVCLLKKETIDRFVNTFIDCPVIINHKDDIKKEDKQGTIKSIWFAPEDGWFWCSGVLDEEAAEKVEKGFNVSCQYRITEYSNNTENKLHNGNPYDKEILNGVFEHLAIVKTPRYEDAYIAVNAIMATNEDKWITIGAGEDKKGRHVLVKDGQTKEEAVKEKLAEWEEKGEKEDYKEKDYTNVTDEELRDKLYEITKKLEKEHGTFEKAPYDAKEEYYFYNNMLNKGYRSKGNTQKQPEGEKDIDLSKHNTLSGYAIDGNYITRNGDIIKKGEPIDASFAGAPNTKDYPKPWVLESAENEFSTVNYKSNTKIKIKSANGNVFELDRADYYAPYSPNKETDINGTVEKGLKEYLKHKQSDKPGTKEDKKEKYKKGSGAKITEKRFENLFVDGALENNQYRITKVLSNTEQVVFDKKRGQIIFYKQGDLSDSENYSAPKGTKGMLEDFRTSDYDELVDYLFDKGESYRFELNKASNSFLDSFKDFVYNRLTEELNDRLGELTASNEERWITIHPHGDVEDENGKKDYRRLKIEDGETPKEAIDRVYKKDDKKPKVYTEKNYDEFHKLYYKDNADKWNIKKGKGNYYTIDRTKNGIGIITHKKFEELDKYLQDNTFNLDIPKSKVRGKDELQENKDALKTFTDKGFKVIAQYDDGYHIKYILENTNKKTEDKQNNDTNIKAKELIKKKRETVNEHNKKYNYYKRNYEKLNSSEEKKLRNELTTLKNQYYAIEEEEKEYIKDHSKAYSLNADIAGVKKETEMDFEKADNKNVNPNYARDNYEYSHNCQSSVVAYEARRRGYNVEVVARNIDDKTQQLAEHSDWAYIDKSTGKPCEAKEIHSTNSINLYNKLEDQIKPNERYQFVYKWYRGKSQHGHVITIERNEKGEIRLYDPQTDEKYIGKENITRYLKEQVSYKKPTRLLRVDDKDFNEYFINDVVKKK